MVFALFRLGALPVYALPAHRAHEITHLCTTAQAKALIIPDRHAGFDYRTMAAQLRHAGTAPEHVVVVGEPGGFTPLAELRADRPDPGVFTRPEASDAAFLQLSGGTTGLPKLIPRTHDDYLYSVRASAEICALGTDTVYLAALPAVHNFPMSSPGFLGTFHAGGTVVLAPNPSPDTAFSLIETERVTITAARPPDRAAVAGRGGARLPEPPGPLFAARPASRRRQVRPGSGPPGPPVLGCTLQQVFGMAEGLVNYTRLDDPDDIITTTQGRPISPDDEIRIVDDADRPVPDGEVGHLLTRGPYTIRGYYRAEEHNATAFTPDGFYRTGDLVRRTPTGHLVVEGRAKDQINRGGEQVSAEEVENHILAHPAVHDAAVVGMSDPYLGERVCAYVIARTEPPSRSELLRFLRERGLASYKIPDRVEFVDRFPVTGVGKISRSELRRELARRLDTTR